MRKTGIALTALLILGSSVTAAAGAESLPSSQWWIAYHGIDSAWQASSGAGVTLAVIDTGVDATHPDLAGRVLGGADFSGVGTPDGATPVGSASYHGTMVASLLVGQGSKTGGVWGVAPEAQILSISVGLGVAGSDTDNQIAAAVRWAVDADADIINLSLSRSSREWPKSWDDAFLYAFEHDVIVVAALGTPQETQTIASSPGTIPGVVTVAAIGQGDEPSDSRLASTELDLMAAGENLLGSFPGNEIRTWGGASAAAPIVSGSLALLKSAHPELSSAELISVLLRSCRDVAVAGYDAETGYGVLDVSNALANIAGGVPQIESPEAQLQRWIELYRPSSSSQGSESPSVPRELVLPPTPEALRPAPEASPQVAFGPPQWVLPVTFTLVGFGFVALIVLRRKSKHSETRESQ